MYDPTETEISRNELVNLSNACKERNISTAIIGGWAAYFYVNQEYKRAFGKDYLESRDIDIFFDPSKENEFEDVIYKLGFKKDGFNFRYEKIFHRESKKFIPQEESKKEQIYNLIYIFLDVFSNQKPKKIGAWWDLEPLKKIAAVELEGFGVADIDTLIALKCTAIFARDKADKENKDACDLYALLEYSKREFAATTLLIKAIQKILDRPDLLYAIAQHILSDTGKQNIVEVTLKSRLKELTEKIPYGSDDETISKKDLDSSKKVESPS
ncbi:MAG: nucleotidyl transferase AbiEii/AbiGii toxin family protein [Nanoarchaeota archaeon]|nr:nucleotidyl transferase AbiEii/AbiGii toxin family protein [Nanoarchaeota archaeon]